MKIVRTLLASVARFLHLDSAFRLLSRGVLVDALEDLTVADAVDGGAKPELIPANMPYEQVVEKIKHSTATVFPIVDERSCLVGLFSLSDLRQIMNERAVGRLVVAGDIGTTDSPWVLMSTNLNDALRLFTEKNLDAIPIVEETVPGNEAFRTSISSVVKMPRGPVGTRRVIGLISRRDLIAVHHKQLHSSGDHGKRDGSSGGDPEALRASAVKKPRKSDKPKFPPAASAAQPGLEMLDDPPEDRR